MLIFGDRHLRSILAEYMAHYNGRRPHRSRQLLPPGPTTPIAGPSRERIKRRPVLGGLINEYERATQKPWSKSVAEFWRPTGLAIDAATGVLVAIAHRLPARVHPAPASLPQVGEAARCGVGSALLSGAVRRYGRPRMSPAQWRHR